MTEPSLFPDITTREERRSTKRNPQPEFTSLSMGAGVQGTTIALLMAEGRLPKVPYAVFSDTGWEPKRVYQQLDRVERELFTPNGIQLIRLTNGNIRDDAVDPHAFTKMPLFTRKPDGRPGGLMKRTCTPHYKLTPIFRWMREMLGGKRASIECKACNATGFRAAPWLIRYADDHTIGQCSVCRGRGHVLRVGQPPTGKWIQSWVGFSVDEMERCAPSGMPYTENAYPLLDLRMTRDDCTTYLTERGWGDTVKSACIGCPYHQDDEWKRIQEDPDEWAQAVELDEQIRHRPGWDGEAFLHHTRIPLSRVVLNGDTPTTEHQGCSPYGCRSGDPLEMPALWDDLDEML